MKFLAGRKIVKVYYDTETTGLDYKKHSIHQLAGIVEVNGKVAEEFDIRMAPHPKAKIDPSALLASGVTEEEIRAYPDYKEGQRKFRRMMDKYIDVSDREHKAYLIGFNSRGFDDDFLTMLYGLCHDRTLFMTFWGGSIDVIVLAEQKLMEHRHKMPSFKLHRVARSLGLRVKEGELHGALYDATLTRYMYKILTGCGDEIPEGNRFWYHQAEGTGEVFKMFSPDYGSAERGQVDVIGYFRFIEILKEQGRKDGDDLIWDELL